ncbi:MAG: DUF4349 domain-containing protein [Candidatus Methanoperedens sp.]|nr:DUF4349 domain-containing protein [Candidatus Methanoperedens sp.]
MKNKTFILIAVSLLVITAGCLSSQKAEVVKNFDRSDLSLNEESPNREGGANDYKTAGSDRKIISMANIQIEVQSVQAAFNQITNITIASGGFISSSSIYDAGGRNNGRVIIRVPQKNFYPAVEQIESAGTVKSRQISGQDVTEEFIDLEARLGNLKKQETRLQEILKMAATVKDVLEIEHELERVRGEIERLTGRLNYLNQSVEMSTISVNAMEPAPLTGEEWGITDALGESLRGFVASIKGIIIFIGYAIPIAVFLIVAIFVARGLIFRLREWIDIRK